MPLSTSWVSNHSSRARSDILVFSINVPLMAVASLRRRLRSGMSGNVGPQCDVVVNGACQCTAINEYLVSGITQMR